jgi:hypothetical protein
MTYGWFANNEKNIFLSELRGMLLLAKAGGKPVSVPFEQDARNAI